MVKVSHFKITFYFSCSQCSNVKTQLFFKEPVWDILLPSPSSRRQNQRYQDTRSCWICFQQVKTLFLAWTKSLAATKLAKHPNCFCISIFVHLMNILQAMTLFPLWEVWQHRVSFVGSSAIILKMFQSLCHLTIVFWKTWAFNSFSRMAKRRLKFKLSLMFQLSKIFLSHCYFTVT